MKKYRQTLAILLLLSTPVLSIAGVSIGLTNSNSNDKFRGLLEQSMSNRAQVMDGVLLIKEDAQGDEFKQLSQIDIFIEKKIAAIIVMPVNSATEEVTKRARKNGIPVVYVNSRPLEAMGDGTAYVGSDEIMAGRMQGELLAKKLDNKGSILILKGPSNEGGAINRTKGLKAVLAGHVGMTVFGEEIANWKRSEGKRIVADILKKGQLPNAIAANNDEMALGAIDAMTEAGGAAAKILVIGVDATADALIAVKTGKMTATVLQNAKGQGRAAVDMAFRMANKQYVPKTLLIPFELVVLENIDKYMAK